MLERILEHFNIDVGPITAGDRRLVPEVDRTFKAPSNLVSVKSGARFAYGHACVRAGFRLSIEGLRVEKASLAKHSSMILLCQSSV